MSLADDEDEDSTNIGVTRYPCMPSLVALQQMRNRLHLAHLGKKLMKWTALATGKELRKTAHEIAEVTQDLADEMRNAFIILARCRYFYPSMNNIVLQDVAATASVSVDKALRTASCVKVMVFDIVESGNDPYPNLGIGQGGQSVRSAKDMWLALLKKLIKMLQLRQSFETVEATNKGATNPYRTEREILSATCKKILKSNIFDRKSNVLGKVVIPRTISSVNYILSELEEMAREEFFRMKKIIEIKAKIRIKSDEKDPRKEPIKEEVRVDTKMENCEKCGAALSPETKTSVRRTTPAKVEMKQSLDDKKLEDYKEKLTETSQMTKDIIRSGIVSSSITKFLKDTEELQKKLQVLKTKFATPVRETDSKLTVSLLVICDHCKKKLEEEKAKDKTKPKEQPEKEEKYINDIEYLPIVPLCASKKTDNENLTLPLQDCKVCGETCGEELTLPYTKNETPKPSTTHLHETFESEVKEIVKIIRVINPDGSITEEKKIVKIRKEIRAPANARENLEPCNSDSDTSGPYQSSRTVGLATIINSNRGYSIPEALSSGSQMEVETYTSTLNECPAISSTSFSKNDEFDVNATESNCCKTECTLVSSAEIESTLCSFESLLRNESATCAKNPEASLLTHSDMHLLTEMEKSDTDNKLTVKRVTKSSNEINKKCGHSVSL